MTQIIVEPIAPAEPAAKDVFTAADRCDRCGAQAYARSVHVAGPLLWCAHHLRKHKPALAESALEVIDKTHLLNEVNRQQGDDHA